MTRVLCCFTIALSITGCFMTGFDDDANSSALSDADSGKSTHGDGDGDGDKAGDGDGDKAGDGDGDGDGDRVGDGDGDASGDGDGDGDVSGDGDGDGDIAACELTDPTCGQCDGTGTQCAGATEIVCEDGIVKSRRACNADGDDCKVGLCTPGVGCQAKSAEAGTACATDLFCTSAGTCYDGICTLGGPSGVCDSYNSPCLVAMCNEDLRKCGASHANDGDSCGAGAMCSGGVCYGTQCEADCNLSCVEDVVSCELGCGDPTACSTQCPASSSCSIDCGSAGSCQATCGSESTCSIDCTYAGSCTVSCNEGAVCILDCYGREDGSCGFTDCPNQVDCQNGYVVCGGDACPTRP